MISKTTAALLLGVAASASAAGAGQSCFVPSIRAPAMGLSVVSHGSLSASVPASSNAASSRSAGAALCMSASSDKKAPETALSMVKDSVMVKGCVVEDKELASKERVRKIVDLTECVCFVLVHQELARARQAGNDL
uniref:Uncharacterized protein n=1 Tax=Hemiselmis tepida TaxID=464990 RepID=A0A7S0Z206_9CRYP|mmetsp:Transcript_890/g.2212  ORF Transcript_890/g.2212 Transcript_890/m.2212 type:complete len:136 (+) Transcript_890:35-442(+)